MAFCVNNDCFWNCKFGLPCFVKCLWKAESEHCWGQWCKTHSPPDITEPTHPTIMEITSFSILFLHLLHFQAFTHSPSPSQCLHLQEQKTIKYFKQITQEQLLNRNISYPGMPPALQDKKLIATSWKMVGLSVQYIWRLLGYEWRRSSFPEITQHYSAFLKKQQHKERSRGPASLVLQVNHSDFFLMVRCSLHRNVEQEGNKILALPT